MGILCASTCLCLWIPLIFILSAANVLPTCEDPHFGRFLIFYSLFPFLIGHGAYCIVAVSAYRKLGLLFKHISGFAVSVCFIWSVIQVWAWVLYISTSDSACYDGERQMEHYINPRTLLFISLVTQSCLAGLGLFCVC